MMSGPALRNTHSHRSIHDAAYREAKEITEILQKVYEAGDQARSLEIAYVLVEQWETRTLQHADAEEKELYAEALDADPRMGETIIRLKRDHDILRSLVKDIKATLGEAHSVTEDMIFRFFALLPIVEYHSRQEEDSLVHTLWRDNSIHGT